MVFPLKRTPTCLGQDSKRILGSNFQSVMKSLSGFGTTVFEGKGWIVGNRMPHFERYIGIDYSGAETADSSCKGIRVYSAESSAAPEPVQPPPSPRRYWTRRGLAEWLCDKLADDIPTIVGIDHAFSFPLAYFEQYRLSSDWQDFLIDFQRH